MNRREALILLGTVGTAVACNVPFLKHAPPTPPIPTYHPPTPTEAPLPTQTREPTAAPTSSPTSTKTETPSPTNTETFQPTNTETATPSEHSVTWTDSQGRSVELRAAGPIELRDSLRGPVPWHLDPDFGTWVPFLPTVISGTGTVGFCDESGMMFYKKETQFHAPAVVFSMDDGYWPQYTGNILDIAQINGWRMSFYFNTMYFGAEGQSDILRRILAEGHELGYHTSGHYYQKDIPSIEWLDTDLAAFETRVREMTGVYNFQVRTVRPPYGDLTDSRKLWQLWSASRGLPTILWDYTLKDPDPFETALETCLSEGRQFIFLSHTRPEDITFYQNHRAFLQTLDVPFIPAIDSLFTNATKSIQ